MTQASGQGRKRGNYQMKGHRKAKIAPVSMKKQEHQYVIDGYLIEEVLKQLPEGIDIIQAKVRAYSFIQRKKIIIPNELRKLGVQSVYQGGSTTDINIVFDKITKSNLIKDVKEVCKKLSVPYEKAHFRYIVLDNGQGKGKFDLTTKEVVPDETDLRKKLRVLGITTGEGKVQSLLSDLGAKKFYCRIKEEPVKFIMCSRE